MRLFQGSDDSLISPRKLSFPVQQPRHGGNSQAAACGHGVLSQHTSFCCCGFSGELHTLGCNLPLPSSSVISEQQLLLQLDSSRQGSVVSSHGCLAQEEGFVLGSFSPLHTPFPLSEQLLDCFTQGAGGHGSVCFFSLHSLSPLS